MHRIIFKKEAAKALNKLPRNVAKMIREKLDAIAADPYAEHPNVKKLQGRDGYRLRVGNWRIIYEIQKEQLVILVLKAAPRGEVYR
ncbi:MAG: type II toxin-antitoxin system RelE/ParE family toxin [Anaerolineales bacterium]